MQPLDARVRPLCVGILCGALILLLASLSMAAEAVPLPWPNLVAALEQADPELVAARGEVEAQRALVDQARARPNPALELELSDIALREGEDPIDPRLRAAYSIEQPAAGLISRRVALAELEVRRAEADLALVRQERLHTLLPDWIEASRLNGALALALENVERLNESVALTRLLVDEGEVAGTDLRRLEVEAGLAESSRAGIERELIAARGLLALQLGLPTDELALPPLGTLFPLESGPDLAAWQALAITHQPELLRDRAELERLTLEQAVAEAEGRAGVNYSVFLESTEDETVAGAGISIPLKQPGNGTRSTQESLARRREALAESVRIREVQLASQIAVQVARVAAVRAAIGQLKTQVLHPADAALATAHLAWQEGEGSLLNYLDAQRQQISIAERLLEAQAELARSRGTLMLTAGLTTWPEGANP